MSDFLALMEYHSSDDKTIATKVFELGLKGYHDKSDYVLHYLDFLIQINDQPSILLFKLLLTTDARALFERTVSKLSPQAARPLFDRFYKYECEYGETGAIRKLSKRIADLYPEGIILRPRHLTTESNLSRFMTRHTLFGVNPIPTYDLPPPLPPTIPQHPAPARDEDASSVISSRANSVQPSEMDEPQRVKLDRFGRQIRERTNSPDLRTNKKKISSKRELPPSILEFLAALPPANMFDGATFHVDELVKLIRDANVPYPVRFVVKTKRARGSDDEEGPARGMKKYRDD